MEIVGRVGGIHYPWEVSWEEGVRAPVVLLPGYAGGKIVINLEGVGEEGSYSAPWWFFTISFTSSVVLQGQEEERGGGGGGGGGRR